MPPAGDPKQDTARTKMSISARPGPSPEERNHTFCQDALNAHFLVCFSLSPPKQTKVQQLFPLFFCISLFLSLFSCFRRGNKFSHGQSHVNFGRNAFKRPSSTSRSGRANLDTVTRLPARCSAVPAPSPIFPLTNPNGTFHEKTTWR